MIGLDGQRVYLLVKYPQQPALVVIHSRAADDDLALVWQDTTTMIAETFKKSNPALPLVTIYAPEGIVPLEMLAHRWKASPAGMDVLHLGDLALM